jgi:putative phosphoribosyl transferase
MDALSSEMVGWCHPQGIGISDVSFQRGATMDHHRREGSVMPAIRKEEHDVTICPGQQQIHGVLTIPEQARGLVIFSHGRSGTRWNIRNQYVARVLEEGGFATLVVDLLDDSEAGDRSKLFNVELLAERLQLVTQWADREPLTRSFAVGYFGASLGAGAALVAAARLVNRIQAVVTRGGRPDLASQHLPDVRSPTLLIVGGKDHMVIDLNEQAIRSLRCCSQLALLPGANHLFEEPGMLQTVGQLSRDWFTLHLEGA